MIDENNNQINILLNYDEPNLVTDNINPAMNKDNTELKKILENDEIVKGIRNNTNNKYKYFFNTKIIKQLISYCLNPNENLKKEQNINLRYTYYSCLLLCSQCVLLFSKSIKNIKESNNRNIQKCDDNQKKDNNNENNNNSFSNDDNLLNKSQENIYNNPINDDLFDIIENIHSEKQENKYNDEYFNFINYSEIEEKYIQITETENKRDIIKEKAIEYDEEEKYIINDILNEIFKMLNFINSKYEDEQTYLGYFEKIINYMLMYETDIIIDYLFMEPKPKIYKLYQHLDKASIESIMENILNILVDKEDKVDNIINSKYKKIILDLLNELTITNKYEKAEFICELMINTVLNNNEKVLIELIFNNKDDNNMIKKLFNNLNKLIINNNGDNEKITVYIIQVLCQLNNIIMNSFYESLFFKKQNNYINLILEDNKKLNTFEYQYFTKKNVSYTIIFEAYQKNIDSYFKMLNDIYCLIKKDIINIYNEKKVNNNSYNNNNGKNINKNKKFGYKYLYEWKFILNILKIYVYSFYAIENINIKNEDYFDFQELFPIFIELYFEYLYNNIYQNIFIEIIRLMCEAACPKYLNKPLLNKDKTNEENIFIFKIINNLKQEINNKYNLLIGSNIEVLRIFFTSFNPAIIKHFNQSKLDNNIKDIFIDSINQNFKRKLFDDDYEYSFSEIFNSEKDSINTFDGNDKALSRNYNSFKILIKNFLEKYEKEKTDFLNNNNKKEEIKKNVDYNIYSYNNIIEEKENIEYVTEENNFEIETKLEIKIEEEFN